MCFGTLTLGPLQANLPIADGAELIARAIERGVNFFDTAQLYGTYTHLREGMRLAKRDDIVIASKTYAYSRALALEAVDGARRALDRDVVDIFLLHEQESAMTLRGHRDALDALYECKAKGVIRAVGASMHHVAAVAGAARLGLDVVHPLMNIDGLGIPDGDAGEMEAAVKAAREAGTGVYSMKPLGGGNLLRKADECLRYALGLPYVDSVAIGIQSADELDANIGFWQTGSFTAEASAALAGKTRRLHIEDWCNGCAACVGRCGQSALAVVDGKAVCRHESCVICGYCSAACPEWAIKVV
jgi:aryl-alcohol dehydrogenase-like predicted oxidoreductase